MATNLTTFSDLKKKKSFWILVHRLERVCVYTRERGRKVVGERQSARTKAGWHRATQWRAESSVVPPYFLRCHKIAAQRPNQG